MTGTAPKAAPAQTRRDVAENLLIVIRDLRTATGERPATGYDAVIDQCTESLVTLMGEFGWFRGMALKAIDTAITRNMTLREAMLATQAG